MTTQPAAPEIHELERVPSTLEDVAANLLRNLAGGLAIGALLWVILSASPWEWRTVNTWSGRAAGVGVAIALIVYGLGDDTRNWWRRRELAQALQDAEECIDLADEELSGLRAQLAVAEQEVNRLRAEVAGLRANRNFVAARPELSDPPMADAQELVRLYYANGVHPARAYMVQHYAWSERRYPAALDLLRQAGVVTLRGSTVRWMEPDAPAALRRLVSPNKAYLETSDAVSLVATGAEGAE